MTFAVAPITIAAAYLLGSIPFGLILAKAHGKDLRSVGSGNIGATNVARALGKKWAYLCFVLDVLKGLVPMIAAMILLPRISDITAVVRLSLWLAVGCAAILGHIFPIYLKFKGGKGVATSLGVALGLWPWYTIGAAIAFAVWGTVLLTWRYVSLASVTASAVFFLTLITLTAAVDSWTIAELWPLLVAAFAIPATVIVRHISNIKRLLAGTENKIGRRTEK